MEKEFLKIFYATTGFSIQDDVLRLYKNEQVTLVFKAGQLIPAATKSLTFLHNENNLPPS